MRKITFQLSDPAYVKLKRMARASGRSIPKQLEWIVNSSTEMPGNAVILPLNPGILPAFASAPPEPSNDQSLGVKQPLDVKTLQTSTETSTAPRARTREAGEYVLPDPKTDPIACLVISFKTLKGIPHEDRSWDKIHFARNAAPAKKLLDICGDLKTADRCLVAISTELKEKGFPWSLETVLRQAHDWLAKERKTSNGAEYRQRLFDHLAKQRTAPGLTQTGATIPAGSMLDRLRNLADVRDRGAQGRPGDRNDDRDVAPLRESALEESADRKQPA